jgi:hypothetical protein
MTLHIKGPDLTDGLTTKYYLLCDNFSPAFYLGLSQHHVIAWLKQARNLWLNKMIQFQKMTTIYKCTGSV